MDIIENKTVPLGTLTLGDYIGRGGYGEVYKARLEKFDQDFAIKLLDPSPFHSDLDKVKERFIMEAKILMNLRHPNIIPIYGVGEHEGRPYILMEYFEGFNLNDARTAGTPNPNKVLDFIEYVANALGHAHNKNIIHRDIKPSNLLTRRGDARVVDFGISHILDPEGTRFTETGNTPVGDAYAAPELIDNPRLVDPRCDIYSLGACWFWLLTGTTPRGRNWEAALRHINDMEQSYENVLLKTLEQIDVRYQTMNALIKDVKALKLDGNPDADGDGELDDDTATMIGVIFENYIPESEPISTYRLEQELSGHLTRFAFSISLVKLRRRNLIENKTVQVWNDEPWDGLILTDDGQDWVEENRHRVEQLLDNKQVKENKVPDEFDDDIPF